MFTDPVCGMQVDSNQAVAQSNWQGQTFYFCSDYCKEQFEQNPEQYAAQQAA